MTPKEKHVVKKMFHMIRERCWSKTSEELVYWDEQLGELAKEIDLGEWYQ